MIQTWTRWVLSSMDIVVILQHHNTSNCSVISAWLPVKWGKMTIFLIKCPRRNCHTIFHFPQKYPICSHTNRYHDCQLTSPWATPFAVMPPWGHPHTGLGQICWWWSSDGLVSTAILTEKMCRYVHTAVTDRRHNNCAHYSMVVRKNCFAYSRLLLGV